jgi:hypothetical protein
VAAGSALIFIGWSGNLCTVLADRSGGGEPLAETLQKAKATFPNALHIPPAAKARKSLHGGQAFPGTGDVGAQSLQVIREHPATFASA